MSQFTTEFAQPVNNSDPTHPFDDNFFSSDSHHFSSDLFAADSTSVTHSAAGDYAGNPLLPETHPQESLPLREWRRQNAALLAEKEKTEKVLLEQILNEADGYRVELLENQRIKGQSKKAANREKEKLFLASKEKFDAEVDKDYWKSIAELLPTEITDAGKRGKKEQEMQHSVDVIQGPKPGSRTDLSRMRQILLKLKDDSPSHLKLSLATNGMSEPGIAGSDYEAATAVTSPDPVVVA